jgi:uncharacterized protein YkwD
MAVPCDRRNLVPVNGIRALSLVLALAALAATAILADAALATSHSERNLGALNHQVLTAVNRFRVAHGLAALHESAGLDRSARRHSLELGRVGYFGHSSADGTIFWRRIQHYYPKKTFSYWSVGENLVWRSPSLSAAKAMGLWIASPTHLANQLSKDWRQIGVSAVSVAHAPGVYGGGLTVIITTDFGVRR